MGTLGSTSAPRLVPTCRLLIVAAAATLIWAISAATMSQSADRYICSPMQGILTGANGEPAAGIQIRRDWIYDHQSGSDTAMTDQAGRFAFDAVAAPRKGLLSLLSTPVVVQRYYVEGDGETEILYINSRSLDLNHEAGGAEFSVSCDLGKDATQSEFGWGVCSLN